MNIPLPAGLAFALAIVALSPAMAQAQPDAAMMVPVEKIARFIETGDDANLSAFAESGVVIIENFPPHLFEGPDAVARWAKGMRAHMAGTKDLKHRFGRAHDFGSSGERAYFSLPTHWSGVSATGKRFEENGGWAFVLTKQRGEWRVLSYGWAVTSSDGG